MNRLLLDTSAYSGFLSGHEGIRDILRETDEIVVTPIVLGELRAGFAGGRREKKNEEELASFLVSPRVRIADVDSETTRPYAAIATALRRAGTPIPTNDIWIAASAMQFGLRVVTRDAHFEKVPQILVDLV